MYAYLQPDKNTSKWCHATHESLGVHTAKPLLQNISAHNSCHINPNMVMIVVNVLSIEPEHILYDHIIWKKNGPVSLQ